jgi:hypothetical protein
MTLPKLTSRRLLTAALAAALVGCGTSGSGSPTRPTDPDPAPVVALYRSRCGACHRPVAPGSLPADKLHAALLEHRKRTRLTEAQWAGLEAFLAPAASAH